MVEKNSYDNLLEQIDKQIERFNEKRRYNETKYSRLAVIQILAGVFATLILGWSISQEYLQYAKNIALVLTSITTVCTLLLSHFQFKDHYVAFTWVVSQLRQLRSELVFRQQLELEDPLIGLDKDALTELHSKFSAILSVSNTDWRSRMSQAISDTENNKL